MLLLVVLCFCCIRFTNQEICSSPGDLPAPQLFLAKESSEEGDIMVLKCKISSLSSSTRVIICKDGKNLASQPVQEGKFAYEHKVKATTAGRFTCLYQHKDHQNQEKNSLLSVTQNLNVPDDTSTSNRTIPGIQSFSYGFSSKLILGITIPSLLAVGVVCFFLARKVPSKWRETRKPRPCEENAKNPEDLLEYTTLTGFARASATGSQPNRDMVVTYATIGHCTGQKASCLAAGKTGNDLHPYDIDE